MGDSGWCLCITFSLQHNFLINLVVKFQSPPTYVATRYGMDVRRQRGRKHTFLSWLESTSQPEKKSHTTDTENDVAVLQ